MLVSSGPSDMQEEVEGGSYTCKPYCLRAISGVDGILVEVDHQPPSMEDDKIHKKDRYPSVQPYAT